MDHRKKISIEKLQPGMYVENVLNEEEIFLFSADQLISGYHQIDFLKRQGVAIVYINTAKGKGIKDEETLSDGKLHETADPEQTLPDSNRANEIFSVRYRTISTVKQMMLDIKAGKLPSVRSISGIVDEMIDQVLENPDTCFGLCQISSFSDRLYIHSVNVAVLMIGLASELGYSREKTLQAGIGGILHDLGKVRLPEELVFFEGAYTNEELNLVKKHPQYALEMIEKSSEVLPSSCLEIIGQHHERLNGSGYPQKLKGSRINEMAFICAVCDVYDSLTSEGFRRKACIPQEALALIYQGADDEYPRKIVEHLIKLLGIYPVGSLIVLESGEIGIVTKINRNNLLLPQVMILFDSKGGKIPAPFVRDLSKSSHERERELWKVKGTLDPEDYGIEPVDFVMPVSTK